MFNFLSSFGSIEYRFGIPKHKQIEAMIEGVRDYDLQPFDYFDNCIYLSEQNCPVDYIGIKQAAQLWTKYDARLSLLPTSHPPFSLKYDRKTYYDLFLDKNATKNHLKHHGINTPETYFARKFMLLNKSFVIKPNTGKSGNGVEVFIFDKRDGKYYSGVGREVVTSTKYDVWHTLAEEYIEPIGQASSTHHYGSIRVLIFTRNHEAEYIASIMKFRHNASVIDNYDKGSNGVIGIDPITGGLLFPTMVKKRNNLCSDISSSKHPIACPDRLRLTFPTITAELLRYSKTLSSPTGMFLGFDVMLRNEPPWYTVLEVNTRPGFDIMQAGLRRGLKPCLRHLL